MDQLVLSPIYVTMFLVTIGVLEGQGWNMMKEEFKDTGVSMIISDVMVWTPAQTFNFYFVPTRFRVLFDNCISFAMDMWYSYLRFDRHPLHTSSSMKVNKEDCDTDNASSNKIDSSHSDANYATNDYIDYTASYLNMALASQLQENIKCDSHDVSDINQMFPTIESS